MYEYNSDICWNSTVHSETEVVVTSVQLQEANENQKLEEPPISAIGQITSICEIDVSRNFVELSTEQQLEYLLSNLLKYGVLTASAVVLLGGILYLINHGTEPADYHIFHGTPSEFRSPSGVFHAILSGSRRAIIQLGLLLLIAIPVLRVVISLLTFFIKREFIYVVITSLVLASLTYSLIGAY
ncbi:DUF1634 domain-containing protein [Anabaena sp. CCY 9910]|uniref:DUF1634 domain-containing protein n=1 Tax=Anabaena sp. CCY 9910 TaxID=3103870 RepID=UPI0039DFA0B2